MSKVPPHKKVSDLKESMTQLKQNPFHKVCNKTELKALYGLHALHNFKMVFPNIYSVDMGEVDCLHITDSGYAIYYEVKASKADFLKDFKKHRHQKMLKKDPTIKSWKPKHFIYILHGFELDASEIPEYAGAYYMTDNGCIDKWKPLKKPPIIYNEKIDLEVELPRIYKRMAYRYLDTQYMFGKEIIKEGRKKK